MAVLITIGIVARNEEKFIGETIQSVVDQKFPGDFEIILVDGNSTDNTPSIAARSLSDSGIKHKIINEKDYGSSGLCFARNLVIDQASSESDYIAFTDADCILAPEWLSTLYQAVDGSGNKIAGAGGPRRVAHTRNSKELVINHLITSSVAMAGNPAFSIRKVKFVDSIPNYNAIYKKEVLARFRYDDSLGMSDDNEINFRIKQAGLLFRYVPDAVVYHRETDSIVQFTMNMFKYGYNITNTLRKHKKLVRSFIPLPLAFIFYLILIIPLYILLGWIVLIPLILYLLFSMVVFIEVLTKTKSLYSFMVFLLLPLQHIGYGCGVLYNFMRG